MFVRNLRRTSVPATQRTRSIRTAQMAAKAAPFEPFFPFASRSTATAMAQMIVTVEKKSVQYHATLILSAGSVFIFVA